MAIKRLTEVKKKEELLKDSRFQDKKKPKKK